MLLERDTRVVRPFEALDGADDDDPRGRVDWIRRHLRALGRVPNPGSGLTVSRLRTLAEIAALDGSLARLAEGHLDALAIHDELGGSALDGDDGHDVWGVWAARPELLRAEPVQGGWRLVGTKPWCSGAASIDRALLTAVGPDGRSRLFAVPTAVMTFDDDWHPLGMRATASCTGHLDSVVEESVQLGGPDAYVCRPGFWHGGIGVAACWHGLAGHLVADLASSAGLSVDPYLRAAAGRATAHLAASRSLLASAGRQIDDDPHDEMLARQLAQIVRVSVEASCRSILDASVTAQGAGALCFDRQHARAVGDLTVYLRQLPPERDAAAVDLTPSVDWWTT